MQAQTFWNEVGSKKHAPSGVLYVTDFLVASSQKYQERYRKGATIHGEMGVCTTSEGLVVRHHTSNWMMDVLSAFDIQWFEQFDFKTMNQNEARTFHCIAQAPPR